MSDDQPWAKKWEVEKPLSKGGQGTTSLVKQRSDGRLGVLKLLRNTKSKQARGRMVQEVTSLRVLHKAGCKVPEVFDDNTSSFDVQAVPLFFVMEYFEGDTLAMVIESSRGLTLDASIEVVRDLAATVRNALENNVLHRDLKPENIIRRSHDKDDLVIVDYGLSFNQEEGAELTRTGETLDNAFLSLPERRVPGGNRRDPRSDLTGLCGLFYYCLTGHKPVDLQDAEGKAPHRRKGVSIRERLADNPCITALEAFFDRGFATRIEDRFQTVEELLSRLDGVCNPAARKAAEEPTEAAKRLAQRLSEGDRKTQIANFSKAVEPLLNEIVKCFSSYHGKLQGYVLSFGQDANPSQKAPSDTEALSGAKCSFTVQAPHHPVARGASYEVRARGRECALFRVDIIKRSRNRVPELEGDWVPLLWFDPLRPFAPDDLKSVLDDIKESINRAMESVASEILSQGPGT